MRANFFHSRDISIEASPQTYIRHLREAKKFSSDYPLCEEIPMNCALGCRELQGDTVDFFYSDNHPGRSTVNVKLWEEWGKGSVNYQAPVKAAVVEIDDLKEFVASNAQVNFIKLDLEGNEIKSLKGAVHTLRSDRPSIVMEYGLRSNNEHLYGETQADFQAFLKEMKMRAVAPWGEDVTDKITSTYSFWYVFLLPEENPHYEMGVHLLKRAFMETMEE